MEIYRTQNGALKVLELPLVAHRTRNEAYFLKTTLGSVNIQTNDGDYYYDDIPIIDTDLEWGDAREIPEADNAEERFDVLKVSAVDNPFYFPTTQTYKFEGGIVALASNAEAVSTGQFGAYPLFVFTTEGIWAMAVDTTGQGAYTTQSPFSREVYNGSVCPVSGGVVFTTDRGVMAISGGQVTELSQPLDGMEELMFDKSQVLESFFQMVNVDSRDFEPVPIRDYIKGAKLAYNYLQNEVILSNIEYFYSYVYNLSNQTWSIIDVVFDITTNSYPELVVYDNENSSRLTFADGNDANTFVAITRPIKAGALDHKRLRQAALRGTFEGQVGFYLLGSNDGVTFSCITGKEYNGSTHRDLVTSMSRSRQYKFFAIAVVGNAKGRISLAELLVDSGFAGNLLR